MLSAKFTISITWPPVCVPLILLSASAKLASTSGEIMYNSTEIGYPGELLAQGQKGQIGDHLFLF